MIQSSTRLQLESVGLVGMNKENREYLCRENRCPLERNLTENEDPVDLMDVGSFRVRVRRRKISRRSLWFLLPGLLLISLDISLIRWSLTLPGDLGKVFFTIVFGVGVALILFSPELARVKPPELSGIYGEQVEKWEKSGEIVIMLLNLSSTETSNLEDMVSSHFGKYILKTFVGRKGKIWTVKGFKVGFMILPVGLND